MFSVSWNGNTLLDETNPVANAWANIQFVLEIVAAGDHEDADLPGRILGLGRPEAPGCEQ